MWQRAGLKDARAVGLLGADDLENLSAALLVAEGAPDVLLVVRMFSTDLAGGIAFPAALLAHRAARDDRWAGLEVAEVDAEDPRLVVALCNAETPTDVLPPRAALTERVLGLIDPDGLVLGARGAFPPTVALHRQQRERRRAGSRPRSSRRQRTVAALRAIPGRVLAPVAAILLVGAVSTTVFVLSDHLAVLDSHLLHGHDDGHRRATATSICASAPDWLKIYDIGLMAVSAVLLASVLALITDALVRTRIDRALGRFPRPDRDHVIVCGLGKAGTRIIAGLRALDVPCIGIEQRRGRPRRRAGADAGGAGRLRRRPRAGHPGGASGAALGDD